MSTNTKTNKYIKMCNLGLQCPDYKECRRINAHNERCRRQKKLDELEELPDKIKYHMNKYHHIAFPICKHHYTSSGGKCKRIHMDDLDDIKDENGNIIQKGIRGNLCYFDEQCNNPYCHFYHGWKCQHNLNCNNDHCPLCHSTIKDVNGNEIQDGRRHMPDPSYFGNYPKKDGKRKIDIEHPKKDETKEEKTEEKTKENKVSQPVEKPKRGRKTSK